MLAKGRIAINNKNKTRKGQDGQLFHLTPFVISSYLSKYHISPNSLELFHLPYRGGFASPFSTA